MFVRFHAIIFFALSSVKNVRLRFRNTSINPLSFDSDNAFD